jgi:hypothetical protein
MDEAGASFTQKLLARESARTIDRAKDKEPDPDFHAGFEEAFKAYVLLREKKIPPLKPPEVTTHEGSIGFLPPGAKAEVAKSMIRGQQAPPMREIEEEVEGETERTVDSATLHLIHKVDPLTTGSKQRMEKILSVLTEIKSMLAKKDTSIKISVNEDDTEPPIRVKKRQAVLHLIKKDSLGHYELDNLSIESPDDVDAALDAYKEAMNWTHSNHPDAALGNASVDGFFIERQLVQEISQARPSGDIPIPVQIWPEEAIFSRGTSVIGVNFRNDIPRIETFDDRGEQG